MNLLNKIISKYMYRTTAALVVLIIVVLLMIQLFTEQRRAVDDSLRTLEKVEQVLTENQADLEVIKQEYAQTCLRNAEVVARIIEDSPEVLNDVNELKEIAVSMEIDEIHIFDTTGRIYAGTHPQYYDFTFDSGEQMMFFKPMLEDRSLKLVQDITPNTADDKPMQYSAVWSENNSFIVQVGMEPVNALKAMEKNELSYIFSLFRVNHDANYYAINIESGVIVGSTDLDSVGGNAVDLGFDMNKVKTDPDGFHSRISGTHSFCIFRISGENYVGRVVHTQNLYRRVPTTMFWIALSLTVVGVVLAKIVVRYMDKYVVQSIHRVNKNLQELSEGNLSETVDVRSSLELSELSDYINTMVRSLLENNRRMSYVLSKTGLYIGVYEYNRRTEKVRFSEHVPMIFGTDAENLEKYSHDAEGFIKFLDEIRSTPFSDENDVYQLGERYIRLDESKSGEDVFGVTVDITEEISKRKALEHERDVDALTGLYNRRGLETKLAELFSQPQELRHSAIIMIDADGLKEINDSYGHEKGDKYLKKIADVINHFGIHESVAARQGGDEYVLFLYGYDSEIELQRTIETLDHIRENSTAALSKDIVVPLRFSMGYSFVNEECDHAQLLKAADERMYTDKAVRKKQLSEAE